MTTPDGQEPAPEPPVSEDGFDQASAAIDELRREARRRLEELRVPRANDLTWRPPPPRDVAPPAPPVAPVVPVAPERGDRPELDTVVDLDRFRAPRAEGSTPVTASATPTGTPVAPVAPVVAAPTQAWMPEPAPVPHAVVLLGMLAWMLWFPLAAGSGALSLVASDGRMSPTILRGDVVVVRPSPDLPYPIDVIIAFRQDGELFTERVVGEEYEENLRLLITASDAVPTGVDRRVDPDDVIGSVRQVHRSLGYPALWFGEPGMLLPRLLVVLLALSSAVGTASMVVRWEMRRSDRALVSAIASGARNQLPH